MLTVIRILGGRKLKCRSRALQFKYNFIPEDGFCARAQFLTQGGFVVESSHYAISKRANCGFRDRADRFWWCGDWEV